jgi:maleylpyruvate isomerase
VGFRDRILRALDTGEAGWFNPHDIVELIELPIESVPLAVRRLGSIGIAAQHSDGVSTRRPVHIGRQGKSAIYVCRADFERAAFHLEGYLQSIHDRSWFGVAATMDAVSESSGRLLLSLRELDADAFLRPSLLPDWSVAHIVAHLTQHADALVRCADDLRSGRDAVMYSNGLDARAEAIEQASRQGREKLLNDLARSCEAFATSWNNVPEGSCRSVPESTPFDTSAVLLRRLREIEVHGSDTGIAELARAAWSNAYVGADLTPQWDTVRRRADASVHLIDEMGGVWRAGDDAAAAVKVTRRNILAWLLDRHQESGLPTLTTWGDQSRWGS